MIQKTCAVVIAYNPSEKDIENIHYLSRIVSSLIIYDNSEHSIADKLDFMHHGALISYGENVGIAKALNIGVRKSHELGYKKVFLFDQDSIIDENFIDKMMCFSQAYQAALWAPNYYDVNNNSNGWMVDFEFWTKRRFKCDGCSALEVDLVITSGSLVDVEIWQELKGFNEDYFIDHVDNEYCFRLKKAGYKIRVNCAITMKHSVGNASLHHLFGMSLSTSNHSSLRRYYMSRNYVDMIKKFKTPSLFFVYIIYLAKTFILVTLFEEQKVKKLLYTAKGLWHGIIGKMGKL